MLNRLEDIVFLYGSNEAYKNILFEKQKEKFMDSDIYKTNTGCTVFISTENKLKHLSISCRDRLPSYNELKKARYELCGDIENMVQVFPKADSYVNLHEYTLHLWELKDTVVEKTI